MGLTLTAGGWKMSPELQEAGDIKCKLSRRFILRSL